MRPLKLTLYAFGPYKDKEIIDFSRLEGNTLFTISGKTGAGKTTIFDGIAFALYGKASGSDREDQRMLRSDFAEEEVHTSAELIFQIKGKIYRIFRQLGHVKKGNKSKTGDKCELYELREGEEIPCVDRQMVSEIDRKIEAIIGLTPDQFKQIVMLPQGEFRKLLTSGTENKEEILRRLFKTEHYKYMNELLKQRKAKLETENQHMLSQMDQLRLQIFSLRREEDSPINELANREHVNTEQILDAVTEELKSSEQRRADIELRYQQSAEEQEKVQNKLFEVKQINDQFNDLADYQNQMLEWKQQEPKIKELKKQLEAAEQARLILPYEQQMEEVRKEYQESTEKLDFLEAQEESMKKQKQEAEEALEEEQQKGEEREKLSIEINRLEGFLPLVTELEHNKRTLQKKKEELDKRENYIQKLNRESEEKLKQLKRLEAEETKLEKETANLRQLDAELNKLREHAALIKKYIQKIRQQNQYNQKLQHQERIYQEAKKAYDQLEQKWFGNQAHVLALHLRKEEPCPVCGSLDHPDPAVSHEAEVSKEELEQKKQQLTEKESAWREVKAMMQAHQQAMRELEQELEYHHLDYSEPETKYQQIVEEGKKKAAENARIEKMNERLPQCKEELANLRKEETDREKEMKQLSDIVGNLSADYHSQQAVYQNKLEQIPEKLRILSELQTAVKELSRKKQQLDQCFREVQAQYRKIHEAFAKWSADRNNQRESQTNLKQKKEMLEKTFSAKLQESNFTSEAYQLAKREEAVYQAEKQQVEAFDKQGYQLEKQIDALQNKLAGKGREDIAPLEEQLALWKEKTQQMLEKRQQIYQEKQLLEYYKTQLEALYRQSKESEKRRMLVTDLFDTLRGQNSSKVSFERYLQMEYLDQIIEAANLRLNDLSNGQFHLTRSDRQETRGKQSGLGLDVYDEYTGQSRDVKTLSGGEKFHASLCLALGMSDVVQSFQGNIVIETMFIDEGFGSLDEESLRKAIDALVQLQRSGRMIGVISHVQELKAVFPATIEVYKTKQGYSETKVLTK